MLLIKPNGLPACVKEQSTSKLIERSWFGKTIFSDKQIIEYYTTVPEVVAFYEGYEDTQVLVRDDHVSYFAGNEENFRIRMNLGFDNNYEIENIELHCYVNREHQNEVAQNFILNYLKDYTCSEFGSQRNED